MLLRLLTALVPTLVTWHGGGESPDLVTLADGRELACRVLFEDDAEVVVRERGKVRELARGEVREVRSVERSLRVFLERLERIGPNDAAALRDLAAFAEHAGLPGEARGAWLRVLAVDADDEAAWAALGGVRQRGAWRLKLGGRSCSVAELLERGPDWKHALELPTAHFRLVTDAPLEIALDVALDVELAFQVFYDVLGGPLGLWVFDTVPEIRAYADPDDYPPSPRPGADAWFSRGQDVLNVNLRPAGPGDDRGPLAGELSEVLLWNAFQATFGKTGELERWARSGLGRTFASAARASPVEGAGDGAPDVGAPALGAFRAHARDPEPLTLAQLLGAGDAAFDSGPDKARYRNQSYTLVHFLLFGEDGTLRAGLARYLRGSYLGQGGVSNLLAALGVDEEALETRWSAHVKRIAAK